MFVDLRYRTRKPGRTAAASLSVRGSTTTSAATPSSTARRCSASASGTSKRCEHEEGVSPAWPIRMPSWSRGTRKPSGCSACTGRPATIRPSRRARRLSVRRRFRTNRCWQSCSERFRALGLQALPHAGGRRSSIRAASASAAAPATRSRAAIDAKGDAEIRLIHPAMTHPNVTLQTGSLVTAADDRRQRQAHRRRGARPRRRDVNVSARRCSCWRPARSTVRRCCCALPTRHPAGWPTRPEQVGRYYMNHNCTAMMAIMPCAGERHALSEDPGAQRLLLRRHCQRRAAGQSADARQDPGADAARRAAPRTALAARPSWLATASTSTSCPKISRIATAACGRYGNGADPAELAQNQHEPASPLRGR